MLQRPFTIQAIIFSLLIGSSSLAWAGTSFSLRGNVREVGTAKQIKAKIKIVIAGEDGSDPVIFPTDKSGNFQIPNLVGGKDYIFFIKAKGYYPTTDTLPSDVNLTIEEVEKRFELKPVKTGVTMQLDGVLFKLGTNELEASSYPALLLLAETMKDNPDMKIRLEGHTDNSGSKKSSITLSEKRVHAVQQFLVQRGIEEKRIAGKGYGSSRPLVNNSTAENRAKTAALNSKC